jgi:hypothetical protein
MLVCMGILVKEINDSVGTILFKYLSFVIFHYKKIIKINY